MELDYINNLDEFTINAGLILDKNQCRINNAPAKKRMFYSMVRTCFELSNGKSLNELKIKK